MIATSVMPEHIGIFVAGTPSQASNELRIEQVLCRARQIHREHGGFFGYDFDDWAQAWAELSAAMPSE